MYLSLFFLLHTSWYSIIPSILLQITSYCSFLELHSITCVYIEQLIDLVEYLPCFYILIILLRITSTYFSLVVVKQILAVEFRFIHRSTMPICINLLIPEESRSLLDWFRFDHQRAPRTESNSHFPVPLCQPVSSSNCPIVNCRKETDFPAHHLFIRIWTVPPPGRS